MLLPKPHIQNLSPVAHGGPLFSELKMLGIDPSSILDFSVSVNPFGPPPGLPQAIIASDLASYPDSDSNLLKSCLADKLALKAENLIIGNGSTELIRLASAAYLGAGDKAFILQPTYAEYELAVRLVGADVISLKLNEQSGFRLDRAQLIKVIKGQKPAAVFLCNPNNPTGEYLAKTVVQQIIDSAPGSLIVLDEAYISFVGNAWDSTDFIHYPNVIVIRSMTKDYALAGVRLGYAFASAGMISTLEKVKPPWNVSSLAQTAGLYALSKTSYVDNMRAQLAQSGRYLKTELVRMGLDPLPSQANFFLVKVGDAAGLRAAMLKKGILVRDCASFGLPQYIRLAHRTMPECVRLIVALDAVGVRNYGL